MSSILETLEPRLLLAATGLGWGMTYLEPAGTGDNGRGEPAAFIDAGDFYWYQKQEIHLLRAQDEVVVGLAGGGSQEAVRSALAAAGGTIAEFGQSAQYIKLDQTTLVIKSASGIGDIDAVLDALGGSAAVAWAGPGFVYPVDGTRVRIANQIVVRLQHGVNPAEFFRDFDGHWQLGNPYVVTLEAGSLAALQAANQLYWNPEVVWAEPDFFDDCRTCATPNDTLYADQWNLNNTGQTGALSDADADVAEAWDITPGSDQVVIAILDNGVQCGQTAHPDLAIYQNMDEVNGSQGVDDDGNGYIDDFNGWDFTGGGAGDNNPNPTSASDNHGTAVAGVAAAAGNNSLGVAGASQHAMILPIKIAEDPGDGGGFVPASIRAHAVYYAAGYSWQTPHVRTWRGADILNCSWGGGIPNQDLSDAFDFVASDARDGLGVPVFIAAGNYASGFVTYSAPTGGLAAGSYVLDWEYWKDPAGVAGEDRVWLANVTLPDAAGTRVRFEGPALPQGWNPSPFGDPAWALDQDPAHTYGVTGLALRSGAVVNQQRTSIRSSAFVLNVGSNITFSAWVSSERGTTTTSYPPDSDDGDWLYLLVRDATTLQVVRGFFVNAGVPAVISNVAYPANLSATVLGVVAVGASTDWDFRADYSQYGNALDIVAPSSGGYAAITTTDRTGADGYNTNSGTNGNYTNTFNGTSAAAPLAAGVGALLLTRNPGLSAELVRTILRNSADEIGGVTYNGNGFNSFYGYGRLNAYKALSSFGANITAEIAEVSPDPRATSVSSISLTFTEAVANFGLEDLSLTRDAEPISLANATLANPSQDGINWTLSGLGSLTARAGKYSLKLTAADSLITGNGGDYLDGDAVEEWLMDTINGTSGADTVTLSGTAAQVVTTGDSYAVDLSHFASHPLYFNGGDGDDLLIVNLASGNPVPAGTVQFDGEDGEEDELQIVGTAAAETVTQQLGQVRIGTGPLINYTTDVELVWVVLAAGNDTLTLDYSSEVGIPTGGIMFEAGGGYDTEWIYLPAGKKLTLSVGGEPGVGQTIAWNLDDLEKMCVVCAAGGDTLAVDYADGNPLPTDGVAFYGGAGNDRVKILGSETEDDTLVLTSGQVQMNSYPAVTYEDVERIWAALRSGNNIVEVNGDVGQVELTLSGEEGGGLCTLTAADMAYTDEVALVLWDSANAEIDSSLSVASFDLQPDTQATLTLGGKVLITKALNLNVSQGLATAWLDITDGSLVIDYTGGANPYGDVQGWVTQAWNYDGWDGYGITSSSAVNDPLTYGIGLADNNSPDMLLPFGDGDPYPLFGNVTPVAVNPESVLVKFTYRGDINLDGMVDDIDLFLLLGWYDNDPESPTYTSHEWYTGDIYGYDGQCDDLDLFVFLGNYGLGVGNPL